MKDRRVTETKEEVINAKCKKDFHKEAAGLGIGELTSWVASLGTVAVADKIAPDLLATASKSLGKVVIEPHLDFIERSFTNLCKLKDCIPDLTKARHNRAENWARTLIVFSAAWVTSMVAKLAARKIANRALHVEATQEKAEPTGNWVFDKVLYKKLNKHDWQVTLWDEGVHLGSLLLLSTLGAKHTDRMIGWASGVLEKLGVSARKAKEVSSMAMIWEVPNALGLATGIVTIRHAHYSKANKLCRELVESKPISVPEEQGKSHVERLNSTTALTQQSSPSL